MSLSTHPASPAAPSAQSGSQAAISVIICTRNRAPQLAQALQAWTRVKYTAAWELIIVDNQSTDDTPSIIQGCAASGLPLVTTVCTKVGLGAAREHGRRLAKAELLFFTDDDCYPAAEVLSAWELVARENADAAFFGGRILLWDESDAKVTVDYRETAQRYETGRFIKAGSLQGANFCIRREALERIGGVDDTIGAGTPFPFEDIDIFARASASGYDGLFDPRPVVYHHHGRKQADLPTLLKAYDKGRGGYYMKCLFDSRMRRDALRHWYWAWLGSLRECWRSRTAAPLASRWRELRAALHYMKARLAPGLPRRP